jgi:PPOX class probable F420-dependent enzyme
MSKPEIGNYPPDPRSALSWHDLEGYKYVSVTTYRRSGAKVSTPVWFVLRDGHVFVWTAVNSGKVKRLRNNPKVAVAPCEMNGKPLGTYFEGTASISKDDSSPELKKAFKSKYGLLLSLSRTFSRGSSKNQVFLDISPSQL